MPISSFSRYGARFKDRPRLLRSSRSGPARSERRLSRRAARSSRFGRRFQNPGTEVYLTELIIGGSPSPSDGDVRYLMTLSGSNRIVLTMQAYQASSGRWLEQGEQQTFDTDHVEFSFIEIIGNSAVTAHKSHEYDQHAYTFRNAWAFDDVSGTPRANFASFADGDATPDVAGRVGWRTANTTATTITGFDHAQNTNTLKHLFLLLIDDANTSIDFGSSAIQSNQSGVRAMNQGDLLLCVRHGGDTAADAVTSVLVWSDLTTADVQSAIGLTEINSGKATNPNNADTITVSHGLGGTPDSVVATPANANANNEGDWVVENLTATTFDITYSLGVTTDTHFFWVAVRNG